MLIMMHFKQSFHKHFPQKLKSRLARRVKLLA